jgi:PST family polysaccharide transporter
MISLVGYCYFPEWFFQGSEKMEYIAWVNFVLKITFVILIFTLINEKSDYWIYPLLLSCSSILTAIAGNLLLYTSFDVKLVTPKFKMLFRQVKSNTPLFVNQFLPNLYNNSSTFILGLLTNTELVGVYGALKKITGFSEGLLNIVSKVFYPFINKKREAFHTYKKIMLSASLLLVLSLFILSSTIFNLFNIDHPQSPIVFEILLIGVLGFAVYDVFGLNYFIVRRKDRLVMSITIIGSIIGFIITFPLIYYYEIIGAAVSLTVARWLIGGRLYFFYRKTQPI